MAARASESLHDDMLDEGRTLQEDAEWSGSPGRSTTPVQQARGACKCKLESCIASREALAYLVRGLLEPLATRVRTSQSVPFDQGRRYEQANQRLWEAYDLAKDGK